tara:strand:- start:1049 stop:1465 length:417 start_codon:yes stop_codon:yes gene_type:complete
LEDHKFQGKCAEYYVAYLLLRLGYATNLVNQNGFDIITLVDDRLIKVEVKSSTRSITNRNGYKFSTKQGKKGTLRKLSENCDSDLVAFVMLNEEYPRVYFKPTKQITGISHQIYSIHLSDKNLEQRTLKDAISKLGRH